MHGTEAMAWSSIKGPRIQGPQGPSSRENGAWPGSQRSSLLEAAQIRIQDAPGKIDVCFY